MRFIGASLREPHIGFGTNMVFIISGSTNVHANVCMVVNYLSSVTLNYLIYICDPPRENQA